MERKELTPGQQLAIFLTVLGVGCVVITVLLFSSVSSSREKFIEECAKKGGEVLEMYKSRSCVKPGTILIH